MGEYIRTTLTFGGTLKRSDVPELIELLEAKMFYDQVVHESFREGRLTEEMLKDTLTADEVNYGDCTDILNWAADHGLSWRQWMDACSGEDPDIRQRITKPDGTYVEKRAPAEHEEPMLPYSAILQADALSTGWATLLADAKWWAQELKLEIVP